MNKAAFLVRFPEFKSAEEDADMVGMIDATLAEAALSISDQFGSKYDEIHGLETAHRLAITPYGRTAKLSTETGATTYGKQLHCMRVALTALLQRLG